MAAFGLKSDLQLLLELTWFPTGAENLEEKEIFPGGLHIPCVDPLCLPMWARGSQSAEDLSPWRTSTPNQKQGETQPFAQAGLSSFGEVSAASL